MKVKVIMPFIDKKTKKVHDTGTVFECTEERLKEINKSGNHVVKMETSQKVKK